MNTSENRRLTLRNRQRASKVDLRLLRRIVLGLLEQFTDQPAFDLGIYVVGASEMTRLNETFLRHRGSTDVITFDYGEPAQPGLLHGEIFVCLDEARAQARRFRTTWQSELVRYVVHGLLHLQGFDDHRVGERRRMKREEARRLHRLARCFALEKLLPARDAKRGERKAATRKPSGPPQAPRRGR